MPSLFLMIFFNNILLVLAYFIIRIKYIMHIMYKICVQQVLMKSVRLLVNRVLLAAKFGGNHKLYVDFLL